MTNTTNGTLAAKVCGRRSIEVSRLSRRSRSGVRTTLGFLAFRAFARALAWVALFGRAGRSTGRAIGEVCGADRDTRGSRAGAGGFPGGRRGGQARLLSRRAVAYGVRQSARLLVAPLFGKPCSARAAGRGRGAVARRAWPS